MHHISLSVTLKIDEDDFPIFIAEEGMAFGEKVVSWDALGTGSSEDSSEASFPSIASLSVVPESVEDDLGARKFTATALHREPNSEAQKSMLVDVLRLEMGSNCADSRDPKHLWAATEDDVAFSTVAQFQLEKRKVFSGGPEDNAGELLIIQSGTRKDGWFNCYGYGVHYTIVYVETGAQSLDGCNASAVVPILGCFAGEIGGSLSLPQIVGKDLRLSTRWTLHIVENSRIGMEDAAMILLRI
ncbi:hypothetical protein Ancab_034786 [Ancistrocladus abbreviatus]